MPLDYNHPQIIRFLQESYDKENEDRIYWFTKNKENLTKAATLSEKHKGYHTEDVTRALIEPLIPVLSQHHKVTKMNCLKKSQIDKPAPYLHIAKHHDEESIQPVLDVDPDAKMKPVDPNVRKILYETVPLGRQRYLNIRNLKSPEEKFYFCETSNNVYGWKLSDSGHMPQSAVYRLQASLTTGAMNRSGPQPDPKHYGHLENQFSKCSY